MPILCSSTVAIARRYHILCSAFYTTSSQANPAAPLLVAQFIAVCSSVKPCAIGENLHSVLDPISRLQERLISVSALIHSPTPQRRPVSGLHPYAAVERSSPPMSPLSEPQCWSLGDISLPAWPAT